MIASTQQDIKRVKISTEYPKEKLQASSKMVYFRLVNKKTFSIFIHEDLKLTQIKKLLAPFISQKSQQIKFIYEGEELVNHAQLLQLKEKTIVHVVVLAEKINEDICIWIHFLGAFRKKFAVKKEAKVISLIFYLKKTYRELKDKDFCLIYLGKIVDQSLNFHENGIENETQLYAVEIINKTINSSIQKENLEAELCKTNISQSQNFQIFKLKDFQKQNKEQLEDKLDKASVKGQINELGIPVSDIFNIHRINPKSQHERNKSVRSKETKTKQIQFDHLLTRSDIQQKNIKEYDFLFAGFQHLTETQTLITDSIKQAKLQFLKHK